jgi:hypothetical protein
VRVSVSANDQRSKSERAKQSIKEESIAYGGLAGKGSALR